MLSRQYAHRHHKSGHHVNPVWVDDDDSDRYAANSNAGEEPTITKPRKPLASIESVKNKVSELFKAGHDVFLRWSVDPHKDQHKWGGKSKDSNTGQLHDGLSAIQIDPEWLEYGDEYLIRRLSEYGFLRSKRSNIKPWLVAGKQLENEYDDKLKDSDGYPLIEVTGPTHPISAKFLDNERLKHREASQQNTSPDGDADEVVEQYAANSNRKIEHALVSQLRTVDQQILDMLRSGRRIPRNMIQLAASLREQMEEMGMDTSLLPIPYKRRYGASDPGMTRRQPKPDLDRTRRAGEPEPDWKPIHYPMPLSEPVQKGAGIEQGDIRRTDVAPYLRMAREQSAKRPHRITLFEIRKNGNPWGWRVEHRPDEEAHHPFIHQDLGSGSEYEFAPHSVWMGGRPVWSRDSAQKMSRWLRGKSEVPFAEDIVPIRRKKIRKSKKRYANGDLGSSQHVGVTPPEPSLSDSEPEFDPLTALAAAGTLGAAYLGRKLLKHTTIGGSVGESLHNLSDRIGQGRASLGKRVGGYAGRVISGGNVLREQKPDFNERTFANGIVHNVKDPANGHKVVLEKQALAHGMRGIGLKSIDNPALRDESLWQHMKGASEFAKANPNHPAVRRYRDALDNPKDAKGNSTSFADPTATDTLRRASGGVLWDAIESNPKLKALDRQLLGRQVEEKPPYTPASPTVAMGPETRADAVEPHEDIDQHDPEFETMSGIEEIKRRRAVMSELKNGNRDMNSIAQHLSEQFGMAPAKAKGAARRIVANINAGKDVPAFPGEKEMRAEHIARMHEALGDVPHEDKRPHIAKSMEEVFGLTPKLARDAVRRAYGRMTVKGKFSRQQREKFKRIYARVAANLPKSEVDLPPLPPPDRKPAKRKLNAGQLRRNYAHYAASRN